MRLEDAIGRRLLQLTCRHHVLGLVVRAFATCLFGLSTARRDPNFQALNSRYGVTLKSIPLGSLVPTFTSELPIPILLSAELRSPAP